ncbi:MAG: aldose 1-epimerase family protein [Pleurocapsa minor GSE-CHR-MK-17-07R]|jgi:hypothetical protein|nr:aldose 1-epimerase family protein [Pleurocapsa minor GSE-CHR-MK 17-07R]
MQLFGQSHNRRSLESYMSDLRQVADIRLVTLDDGQERGVRAAEVRTGSGFDFTVLLDRAMDIGTATYQGIPLAWQSGTGAVHPHRYEPEDLGWLRSFHGGLLALCGITNAGFTPGKMIDTEYRNEALGLHGRAGNIPAYDIRIERLVSDNDFVLRLHGSLDEVSLFGYKLRLDRTIEVRAGEAKLSITDRVRNFGGTPAPLMVLYHCNFGYPVVSPDSTMTSPAVQVVPRDDIAAVGLDSWQQMIEPVPGFAEQVYWHHLDKSATQASAAVFNHRLNIGMALDFNPQELNNLTEWKQMGFGDYTLGIEPGNCSPVGRVAARENGTLRMLPPGETDTFHLTMRIIQEAP